MPAQLIRKVRDRRPSYQVGIDWGNPITAGLAFAFDAAYGKRDLVTGVTGGAAGAGIVPGIGRFGPQTTFSGTQADNSYEFGVHKGLFGATGTTFDILVYFSTGNQTSHFFGQWDGNDQEWLLQNSGGTLVWVAADDTVSATNRTRFDLSSAFTNAGWYRIIAAWRGGTDRTLIINGVEKAPSVNRSNATAVSTTSLDKITIGKTVGGSALNGTVVFARAWRRGLTNGECWALSSAPWIIFPDETIPLFWPSAASSPQTLVQSSTYSNTNSFYTHTLSAAITLPQTTRFDSTNTFYTHALAASIGLAQSSRYDNTNTFYTHALSASITLPQTARYDNSSTFYTHTLSQTGGVQTLTQTARFDNSNTFYAHTLTPGAVTLAQTSRYDNSNSFYTHSLLATIGLGQSSRFDNTNTFYSHTLTPGAVTLVQSSRHDNANAFYTHTLTPGAVTLAQTARFDNSNAFYAHTLATSIARAPSSGYDNVSRFCRPPWGWLNQAVTTTPTLSTRTVWRQR